MVPPKKRKYGLLEQKGQRAKILIALVRGTENISSITRLLGYKNKKSSSITKYIQELQKKDLLIIESKECSSINRTYNKRRCLTLKLDKFFIERANELVGMNFSKKERILLKKIVEQLSYNKEREEFILNCISMFWGYIFPHLLDSLLYAFNYKFRNKKFDDSYHKLGIKLISLSFLYSNSPFFIKEYPSLLDLRDKLIKNKRLENYSDNLELEIHQNKIQLNGNMKKEIKCFYIEIEKKYSEYTDLTKKKDWNKAMNYLEKNKSLLGFKI